VPMRLNETSRTPNVNGFITIAWRLKPTGNFNRKKDTIFYKGFIARTF
jgi:hypothetical protein